MPQNFGNQEKQTFDSKELQEKETIKISDEKEDQEENGIKRMQTEDQIRSPQAVRRQSNFLK